MNQRLTAHVYHVSLTGFFFFFFSFFVTLGTDLRALCSTYGILNPVSTHGILKVKKMYSLGTGGVVQVVKTPA
jgi:hypothetical protein